MRKLIEGILPLQELTEATIRENVRKGYPGNMHLWWNRSPIASSTALLYAALMDEAETPEERAKQLDIIKRLAVNDKLALRQAKEDLQGKDMPTVVDAFSGFGGLSLAAEKLSISGTAGDLNEVATLLTMSAVDLPARFANQSAVHPQALTDAKGTVALAEDISLYGRWLEEKVQEKIGYMYPSTEGLDTVAWLWVRTVTCPNPACKCKMPLASSYVLNKSKGHEAWAEPVCVDGQIHFKIRDGGCPPDKINNKLGSRGGKFLCPACGAVANDVYIKKMGKKNQLGMQMMAVVGTFSGGKICLETDEAQLSAAEVQLPKELPIALLAENSRWFSPPEYGLTEYADLFTARQLTMLSAFCEFIPDVIEMATMDALGSGMSDSADTLHEGGTGAKAYGQAIGTYLSLAISRMTNYHSTICTWDERTGTGRAAFVRQAIPMTWTFVEKNPFADTLGSFASMVSSVAEAVAGLPAVGGIKVSDQDGISRDYQANSILFTELPYYDNVGYADLSDYFYIWLRKCLQCVFPVLFEKIATNKEELSSIPEQYGRDAKLAEQAYRENLDKLFAHFAPTASRDFPSLVFFLYTKADHNLLRETSIEIDRTGKFAGLLQSIVDAGFCVTAVWPVKTERLTGKRDAVRVAIIFRKRQEPLPRMTRRNFVACLKRELPQRLEALVQAQNALINEPDRTIIALGLGLSIAAKCGKILNADGTELNIQDALQLIAGEADGFFVYKLEDIGENQEGTGYAGEL